MQKKTCNKKNTRNKSKKRKHQEPPTTDVDCKEKQPTERTKTGGGREERKRHTEVGGTREGEAERDWGKGRLQEVCTRRETNTKN